MSQLLLVTLLIGFSAPAFAQQTDLQVPGVITDAQIEEAIDNLQRAQRSRTVATRNNRIADAKSVLVAKPGIETFAAEVESEGDKQFTEETSGIPHLPAACFRGTPAETVRLINRALEVGQWEGDEERILSAGVSGSKVILKIEDQPNEMVYDFDLEACE